MLVESLPSFLVEFERKDELLKIDKIISVKYNVSKCSPLQYKQQQDMTMNRKLLLLCAVVLGYKSIEGMQEKTLCRYMEVSCDPTSRLSLLPRDVRDVCILPYLLGVDDIGIVQGPTRLHVAAYLGLESLVSLLLTQGINVDVLDEVSMTPLIVASHYGHDVVVEKLLAQGANVNHQDMFGYTALQFAAEKGFCSIVEKLLAKVADIDLGDNDGNTPLLNAIENNHVPVVEKLLASGADTSKKDIRGITALQRAAQLGNDACVEKLLAAGAEVDASRHGETALYFAASQGRSSVVAKLLKAGANKDALSTLFDDTVLIAAVRSRKLAIVESLLAVNVAIDMADRMGRTALTMAAEYGLPDIVRVLLAAGADKNKVDRWGKSPLDYALDQLRSSGGQKKWYDIAILLGVDEAQLPKFAI